MLRMEPDSSLMLTTEMHPDLTFYFPPTSLQFIQEMVEKAQEEF